MHGLFEAEKIVPEMEPPSAKPVVVNAVIIIVEWTVRDPPDTLVGFGDRVAAKQLKDIRGDFAVLDFVARIDVVDLVVSAFVQDGVQGVGCVSCVEEAAGVGAVALEGELAAL